jgi:transposase
MSLSRVSGCLSGEHGISVEGLLPHLGGVIVEAAELAGGLCVYARVRADRGVCPRCGQASGRVHSSYGRRLADAPAGGRPVVIRLTVRRFFCGNPGCAAVTFAEQVEGLTSRRARRTPPLARMLTGVALALAGRAGARLAALLDLTAGRSSLLRLVMALPDPEAGTVPVLGIDDFAFRRGRDYGTVLINVETGRPVDLLRDREAGTVARWLKGHPGTEVICRDRAGAYADGARQGAPAAVQVADRWHLWHNLAGHVETEAARHRGCLAPPPPDPPPDPGPDPAPPDPAAAAAAAAAARARQSPRGRATLARHAQVQQLRAQGQDITQAAAALALTPATVRRFWPPASEQDLLATARGQRPSLLDAHKPYLNQQWAQGITNARQLHRDITAQGYQGARGLVQIYLQALRTRTPPPPAPPPPPATRDITRWITTRPGHLNDHDTASLTQARARCPHLDALAGHVTDFAKILTNRHGHRLDQWITTADASDLPALHSFARGLKLDRDAARNGLTLPWSSGKVEGNVNRLKMLKRQMYGRAGYPLLRKRVLLTT